MKLDLTLKDILDTIQISQFNLIHYKTTSSIMSLHQKI